MNATNVPGGRVGLPRIVGQGHAGRLLERRRSRLLQDRRFTYHDQLKGGAAVVRKSRLCGLPVGGDGCHDKTTPTMERPHRTRHHSATAESAESSGADYPEVL